MLLIVDNINQSPSLIIFPSLWSSLFSITVFLTAQDDKIQQNALYNHSHRRVQKQKYGVRLFENSICLVPRGTCHTPIPCFFKNVVILSNLRPSNFSNVFLIQLINLLSLLHLLGRKNLRFFDKIQDGVLHLKTEKS
jgi:hypothetical protein